MEKQKIVMAMSGGVDSSVGAALLVEQGYEVIGVTMKIWDGPETGDMSRACCSLMAAEDARRVAALLGIPHYVMNFTRDFARQVIDNFIDEYGEGRTPNPCVRCNRFLKFDTLLQKARALGAAGIATGHYARSEFHEETGRWRLRRGADLHKDQSYVLYGLTQEQLSRTLFPLGEMTKEETRQKALELGLHVATKQESQDICFVPNRDYGAFLRQRASHLVRPGPILNTRGDLIGQHPGVSFFTIGQRKGLGVFAPTPLYVLKIDARTNTIVVGEEHYLFKRSLIAGDVNWIAFEKLHQPLAVSARIRYNMENVPATICPSQDNQVLVTFEKGQRAITPGQSVVFYDGDWVLGGGTIIASLEDDASAPEPALAVSGLSG